MRLCCSVGAEPFCGQSLAHADRQHGDARVISLDWPNDTVSVVVIVVQHMQVQVQCVVKVLTKNTDDMGTFYCM